jgi:hypothetical protein
MPFLRTFQYMNRIVRVAGVLVTATVLYFTIPVVVDLIRGSSLPPAPDWLRDFWDWSRPFRHILIIGIISLSLIGAVVDADAKSKTKEAGK